MEGLDARQVLDIAVVGAGPRGLCVVERLCANAYLVGGDVVVHLVDPHVGSGGRVWTTAQPASLLMNTIASQVTVFTDLSVTCAGPIRTGPSLYEWAETLPRMEVAAGYPPALVAEAAGLGPNSYPSRALYGLYLDWVLRRMCQTAPVGVSIRLYPDKAVQLDPDASGGYTMRLAGGDQVSGLATVVLAQGHVDMPLGDEELRLSRQAAAGGLRYVPPGNPAEVDLDSLVGPGERVALRGMGLNFFDYLSLLTAGRGGRFTRAEDGLAYHPSGREPVIVAGSRRGVPYHARGENEKGVSGRHLPVFLTPRVIDGFRDRARTGLPPQFDDEVWPLISREVELVYYTAMIKEATDDSTAALFAKRYTEASPEAVPSLLRDAGIPDADRWNWDRVSRPDGGRQFDSAAEFTGWLLDLLRSDVAQAHRGNVTSPLKAALDVLRDIRNEVRLVVDHCGLTGRSYRDELRGWYTPLNAYLSIGPPARRIEEMIALIRAGVLTVVGPGLRVRVAANGFELTSRAVTGSTIAADILIEARLPEVDIRHTTDALLQHLMRTGQSRAYWVPDPRGDGFASGGLEVTAAPYHLVDADGRPQKRLFAYGVPTETVHWVTAAGARPGVNSVMLGDADAIARAALSVPLPTPEPALA